MSVRLMSLVWESTVPAPQRFTLLALADRADEDGRCWPSIKTLSQRCCTGESTIRRHLVALERDGVISIEHRFNSSSLYTINLSRLHELADTPCQNETPPQNEMGSRNGRTSHSGGGVKPDPPSQSERTPPPNLSGPPSQSEHLFTIDPSVDPSEVHAPSPPSARSIDRFDEFYDAYPRKRDRRKAQQAWRAALKRKADPDRLIAAAKRLGESGTELRFMKYPASWLNAAAYDNEPDPEPARHLRAVSGGYQPYRNPTDPSVWDEPLLPPNPREDP